MASNQMLINNISYFILVLISLLTYIPVSTQLLYDSNNVMKNETVADEYSFNMAISNDTQIILLNSLTFTSKIQIKDIENLYIDLNSHSMQNLHIIISNSKNIRLISSKKSKAQTVDGSESTKYIFTVSNSDLIIESKQNIISFIPSDSGVIKAYNNSNITLLGKIDLKYNKKAITIYDNTILKIDGEEFTISGSELKISYVIQAERNCTVILLNNINIVPSFIGIYGYKSKFIFGSQEKGGKDIVIEKCPYYVGFGLLMLNSSIEINKGTKIYGTGPLFLEDCYLKLNGGDNYDDRTIIGEEGSSYNGITYSFSSIVEVYGTNEIFGYQGALKLVDPAPIEEEEEEEEESSNYFYDDYLTNNESENGYLVFNNKILNIVFNNSGELLDTILDFKKDNLKQIYINKEKSEDNYSNVTSYYIFGVEENRDKNKELPDKYYFQLSKDDFCGPNYIHNTTDYGQQGILDVYYNDKNESLLNILRYKYQDNDTFILKICTDCQKNLYEILNVSNQNIFINGSDEKFIITYNRELVGLKSLTFISNSKKNVTINNIHLSKEEGQYEYEVVLTKKNIFDGEYYINTNFEVSSFDFVDHKFNMKIETYIKKMKKSTKIIIISVGCVLGVALIAFIIYRSLKKTKVTKKSEEGGSHMDPIII